MADILKTAEIYGKLIVTETIDYGIDGVENRDAVHEVSGTSTSLSPGSTIPATKVFKDEVSLIAAAATLDLTALVRANLPDVDGTGLKLPAFIFQNTSTSGTLTIAKGASNGYSLFGNASGEVTLPAANSTTKMPFVMMYVPEGLADVAQHLLDRVHGGRMAWTGEESRTS